MDIKDFAGIGKNKESQFISTTSSLQKAKNIAHASVNKYHEPVQVVKVDVGWIKDNRQGLADQAYNSVVKRIETNFSQIRNRRIMLAQ